jgi:hypothetical protein
VVLAQKWLGHRLGAEEGRIGLAGSPVGSRSRRGHNCAAVLVTIGLAAGVAQTARADSRDVKRVLVSAAVGATSVLRVSAEHAVFTLLPGQQAATATVDYSAFARTENGAQVVLLIEPLAAAEEPGGAADVETALSFQREGALSGLVPGTPTVAGRWTGSGSRHGRIALTLRAEIPGTYVVPVRLSLVTP